MGRNRETKKLFSVKRDNIGRYHCEEKDPVTGLTLPAVVTIETDDDKTLRASYYCIHGKYLRLDKDERGLSLPTCEYSDGDVAWLDTRGEYHRDERDPETGLTLPSLVYRDGMRCWFIHGKIKRVDIDPVTEAPLPDAELADGTKMWFGERVIDKHGLSMPKTLFPDGLMWWKDENDKRHRDEKDPITGLTLPALITLEYQIWYIHGRVERRDMQDGISLPSVVYNSGAKYWMVGDKYTRPEKHLPTKEVPEYGYIAWTDEEGKFHRTDVDDTGRVLPAVVYDDGRKEWYYNGSLIHREEKRLLQPTVEVLASHSLVMDKATTCNICLESIGGDCYVTSCLHVFHRECLSRSVAINPRCPMCRTGLN